MNTITERDALRAALRLWGKHRHALEDRRDSLVRNALKAGVSIEEIHQSTGLARTTVDRIGKGGGNDGD